MPERTMTQHGSPSGRNTNRIYLAMGMIYFIVAIVVIQLGRQFHDKNSTNAPPRQIVEQPPSGDDQPANESPSLSTHGGSSHLTSGLRDPRDDQAISYIINEYPSENIIKAILEEEQHLVNSTSSSYLSLAKLYELTYAFIANFQRNDIPIFIGFGSHLGARRHHDVLPAVIPFGEKDVDLQIFSLDENNVLSIIKDTLQSSKSWTHLNVSKSDFGYQLVSEMMAAQNFSHYIDFWLFNDDGDKVECIGRGGKGCAEWYKTFHAKKPPKFSHSDYFPPLYQVFGSHKVPIPATPKELETFQYAGKDEHWNTTCGAHRQ